MERSEGTFQAYGSVTVPLPGGSELEVQPLTVREAVPFLRMLHKAEGGDAEAHFQFLEEFPERVGIADAKLSPYEVFEVARSFFHLRRWSPTPMEEGTQRTPQASGLTT